MDGLVRTGSTSRECDRAWWWPSKHNGLNQVKVWGGGEGGGGDHWLTVTVAIRITSFPSQVELHFLVSIECLFEQLHYWSSSKVQNVILKRISKPLQSIECLWRETFDYGYINTPPPPPSKPVNVKFRVFWCQSIIVIAMQLIRSSIRVNPHMLVCAYTHTRTGSLSSLTFSPNDPDHRRMATPWTGGGGGYRTLSEEGGESSQPSARSFEATWSFRFVASTKAKQRLTRLVSMVYLKCQSPIRAYLSH